MHRLFLFFLPGLLAWGQQPAPEFTPPRAGVGITQTRLSLQEAVERALRNNLEIEVERTAQAAAVETARGAQAYLDPSFRWLPSIENRNTPTSSAFAPASGKITENFFTQNFSFRQRTPYQGLTFQADFDNVRQSTNNPFVTLNPFITPRLVLSVALPLLRNREIDQERAQLMVRRRQVEGSDVAFELRVIDVIARTEQAYYDLAAVRADLDVVAESVSLARDQVERTKRFISSGTVAPVELAGAEAELERRQDTYFATINNLNIVENNLKLLIAAGSDDSIWNDILVPTSADRAKDPPESQSLIPDLVKAAVGRRPEFRSLDIRRDINEVERSLARNNSKIQVNLTGAYVSTGLAGTAVTTVNPFAESQVASLERLNELSRRAGLDPINLGSSIGGGVPSSFVGGYGQSLANLFGVKYSTFQGGVAFDWNWRNTAATSALAQTAISEKRLGLERRQLEQGVEAQVRNAMQSLSSAKQRIVAAEASARAAKEKLDSEVRLFQTGESTNFLVLTRQNELADSRRRLVQATLEFNKSVARLEQALGNTLGTHSIRLK